MLDTTALSKRLQEADLDLFPSILPLDGVVSKRYLITTAVCPCGCDLSPRAHVIYLVIVLGFRSVSGKVEQAQKLPLLIRERDLDYQVGSIQLWQSCSWCASL